MLDKTTLDGQGWRKDGCEREKAEQQATMVQAGRGGIQENPEKAGMTGGGLAEYCQAGPLVEMRAEL